MYKRVLLKLSGEALSSPEAAFDPEILKRLAKELKGLTKEEREKEVDLVKHSLNDCKSRTTQLNKQKRKYIAYIKKAEQIVLEEENMNHIPRID